MSPRRSSRPVPVRLARASVLATAVIGGTALAAGPAHAGWTPPAPTPFVPSAVLSGAAPGQVAFVSADAGAAGRSAIHRPGTPELQEIPSAVPDGAPSAAYGPGNALAFVTPGGAPQVGLGRVDGGASYTPVGGRTVGAGFEVDSVAAAPDGTVAALGTDAQGRLHVLFGRPGQPVADLLVPNSANAGDYDIAPLAGSGYAVAWSEVDADDAVVRISGLRVGPDGVLGARTSLTDTVPGNATADEVRVPPGAAAPSAAWIGNVLSGSGDVTEAFVAFSVAGTPTRRVATVPGDAVPAAVEALAFGSGEVLVSGTITSPAEVDVATTRVLPLAGGAGCAVPAGVPEAVTTRVGDAIALVGNGPGDTVVRQDVQSSCAVSLPSVGPAMPGLSVEDATADAEGSVVVVATNENDAASYTVDDRTGPTLGSLRVPSTVAAGASFTASVDATDAWGAGTPTWTLDGAPFGQGPTVTGTAPAAGRHRLEVRATDAAGNASEQGADLTTTDAPPVQDPEPTPPTTPTPPPVPPVPPVADVPLPPAPPASPAPPAAKPKPVPNPSVRIRSLRETSRGWVLRLRVGDASRVRLALYRERYLEGGRLRRPPTCPVRPRPLERPPSGLRGRTSVVVDGRNVTVRVPRPLADALRHRGRYTLSVTAYGIGAKAKTVSKAANRSFTAC